MMYLKRSDSREVGEWHVGEPPPWGVMADNVREVQADSDELRVIQDLGDGLCGFSGRLGPVVRYFGDHAKFIAANIVKCP